MMPSNHLILCYPLLFLSSIFPSIRVFSSESVLRIRSSKYWRFSFSNSSSSEYSGLISFRIDWFDFLAFWGTLKSLLQHHSSKASILWYWDFFMFQLSHPYMTTGKTIALTIWIFVGKKMHTSNYSWLNYGKDKHSRASYHTTCSCQSRLNQWPLGLWKWPCFKNSILQPSRAIASLGMAYLSLVLSVLSFLIINKFSWNG